MQMKNYIVCMIPNETDQSTDITRLRAASFNNYNEDKRDKFKYNKKYVHVIQYILIDPIITSLKRLAC